MLYLLLHVRHYKSVNHSISEQSSYFTPFSDQMYTLSPHKNVPFCIVCIFAKYQPIFKLFYWHTPWKISNKAITEYFTTTLPALL